MTITAGRPIPRRRTNISKLESLLDLRDMIRNSRGPIPRWVYEEERRLQQEIGMDKKKELRQRKINSVYTIPALTYEYADRQYTY